MKNAIKNIILKLKNNVGKTILFVLAILIIFSIVHNIIKNKKVQPQNHIKNVNVIKAELTSLSTSVDYSGKLTANEEVSVSPKSSGKVNTLNVQVGSTVKSGDILFTLDSDALQAQLQQQQASIASANAGLNSANASLDKTKSSGVDQQVVQAQQAVDSAQISYNDAKTSYDRTSSLYSSGAVSQQDLDTAKTKLDSASVALSSAQQNLSLIQGKVGPESIEVAKAQVTQAEAQVTQAEAGLKSIQTQINDTIIESPISGIVSVVNIHPGEISPAATASITIIDSSSLIAEADVPGTMLSKIQVGQSIPIVIPSLSNKKVTGSIETISPDTNSTTQEYSIKIKTNNSEGDLKAGMFAKISLPDENKNNVITVPNEAIKVENGISYLYKVQNNRIMKISVTTGLSNDKITEIISSKINVGDLIVPEGQTFLNDGDKVKILN
ncbi:efflux RND transporter periplasmic adaptor subunit [Clostridium sp. WILCCON 0269]|uniref:Efflux RND transporter periplasmic adaptor subunit n=1 Tax=Candidatus Clostridium eludens TaxID=3381663 RepID=A0ABW8SFP9_9CLOT